MAHGNDDLFAEGVCQLCKIDLHLNQPHTVLHLNRTHITKIRKPKAWILKDSFYNNSTEKTNGYTRGSLVQRPRPASLALRAIHLQGAVSEAD